VDNIRAYKNILDWIATQGQSNNGLGCQGMIHDFHKTMMF